MEAGIWLWAEEASLSPALEGVSTMAARKGLPYSKNALLVGAEGSRVSAGQLEVGSHTSDTAHCPHLLHKPQGARWSSSNQGSRHSEAWRESAQGCGDRQSGRWFCGE